MYMCAYQQRNFHSTIQRYATSTACTTSLHLLLFGSGRLEFSTFDNHSEDGMRSRGAVIHIGAANMPMGFTLLHQLQYLIRRHDNFLNTTSRKSQAQRQSNTGFAVVIGAAYLFQFGHKDASLEIFVNLHTHTHAHTHTHTHTHTYSFTHSINRCTIASHLIATGNKPLDWSSLAAASP
jgi:hypothetical protein